MVPEGLCQGTLIFSDISVVYSFFPSVTFHCTYLYYSSMTSTIISKHCIDFPFAFFYFFIHFSDISIRQTLLHLPVTPISIFIFIYVYFYIFIFISYVTVSHLLYPGSQFSFHRSPSSRSSSFSLGISC